MDVLFARRKLVGLVATLTTVAAGISGAAFASGQAAGSNGIIMSRCDFTHRASDDPIVHPGMAGMSHSHDFWGSRTVDSMSTPASLVAGTTSCKVAGDRSAYWAPTLYADGAPVSASTMLAYYQRGDARLLRPLPAGLVMIAGGRDAVRWACFTHGMARAKRMTPQQCNPGEYLAEGVIFPDCWNGTALDSADHRAHMAYADVAGHCPRSHPNNVPQLTMWILFDRPPAGSQLTLASGELSTAHADFMNGWAPGTYSALHNYCLVQTRPCYKTMYRVLQTLHLPANP